MEYFPEGIITYHYAKGNLVIKSHQSLYDKDKKQVKAHIEMSHIIKGSHLLELSNALGMKLKMIQTHLKKVWRRPVCSNTESDPPMPATLSGKSPWLR